MIKTQYLLIILIIIAAAPYLASGLYLARRGGIRHRQKRL